MPDNEKLLKEIRENFRYFQEEWREIREEARIDMRYISGDPWEPDDKKFRIDNDRPCMAWDELSPYINQLINDPRQNKRAIKINPKGSGATDKTAELRENTIRDIQYNSRAQAAFTTAFQGAAERSYGYFGIGARLVATNLSDEQIADLSEQDPGKLFEQELYISRIPDPDSVMFNPNYKEMDCSDSTECFVLERMTKSQYKRKYPSAKIQDFTPEHMDAAKEWIREKEVLTAAYWKVDVKKRKLFIVNRKDGPIALLEEELPKDFDKSRINRDVDIETRKVSQYVTNGLEILEERKIPIPWIPIVPVFGKEIWVDDGSGSKRMLISLVRMARDPYMAYCFYRSQEAEEASMTPKTPFFVYKGQIDGADKDIWEMLNKVPRAYAEVNATTEASGQQVLPLPTRQPFIPNFQAYEVACEAARRAIQTAMSGSNLPTAAQRRNEKSGVALKEIDEQEDKGTFHFIDNYNFALEHGGRILNAWYPFIYDTKRDIAIREADETHRTVRINDPEFEETDDDGNKIKTHYDAKTGDHGVTVSVGPSSDSQRDEASQYADMIAGNIQAIAPLLPPGAAAKLLALSIRLKQLGPLGDEMADTISPPADKTAQDQQMAQGQQQLQQSQQVIAQMQTEIEKLRLEKAGKVIQGETEKQLQQMQNDVKVLIALITTKKDEQAQEAEMYHQFWIENHGAAHELGLQKDQQAHERDQAAAAQSAAAQQAQVSATPGAPNPGQEVSNG